MKKNYEIKFLFFIILIAIFIGLMYFSFNKNIYLSFGNIKDFIIDKFKDKNNIKDIIGKELKIEKENELKDLKKILELNNSLSDFNVVNATVINRNSSTWIDKLTINKGKKDGVEVGDAVVVSEGLIGNIDSITNSTSIVKLITSNDLNNKVSVKIYNNDKYIYKVLEKEGNELIIRGIDNNIEIEKELSIVTSGLSDKYPSGIVIGTIDKIDKDKYGLSQKIIVKSEVDFDNIRFVTILNRNI